jgi:CubicO group peptidase (beta-lactamase class C family)
MPPACHRFRLAIAVPLCALVAWASPATVRAKPASAREPAALEPLLEPILARSPVPALGAAVFTRDGLVGIGAVGRRQTGDDTPVTRDDLWHLGSCTKSMTATLVARLVEKGRLSFDDTLAKRFQGLEVHPDYRGVTLERLMAHRGGVPAAYPPDLWAWCWRAETDGRGQRARMAEVMLARGPDHPVGTFLYANMGFDLVGAALERLTDEDFERLMKQEVFDPLGLGSAGFGAPGTPGAVTQPRGHRPGPPLVAVEPGPGADNPLVLSPAGRVHMSLADWARYLEAHLGPGEDAAGAARPFLSAATLERLHTPKEGESYAFGWGVTKRPWANGPVLTHAGSNTMWYAVTWLAPGSGFGVLATTNVGGEAAAKACDDASAALIRWYRAR